MITGGFDCVNLFQQAEEGFDKLFNSNRQQTKSFDYHNTMKNGSISEQLEFQEQNFTGEKKKGVFQSSEKGNMFFAILIANKMKNTFSIRGITEKEILFYLYFQWKMATIMMQYWQRN